MGANRQICLYGKPSIEKERLTTSSLKWCTRLKRTLCNVSISHILFSYSPSYYIYIFLLYTSRRWQRTSVQSLSFLCNGLSLKVSSWTHIFYPAKYYLYAMDLTCRDKKCRFRKYVWMRINLENWHGNRNTLECSSF